MKRIKESKERKLIEINRDRETERQRDRFLRLLGRLREEITFW